VALLEPADPAQEYTGRTLAEQGLAVLVCRDTDELFQQLEYESVDLVLIGEGVPAATVIDRILPGLLADHVVGTVVQAAGANTDYRLAMLRAGADLCLDRIYSPPELVALLHAQARRWSAERCAAPSRTMAAAPAEVAAGAVVDTPFSKPGDAWRVLYQGWVLLTPNGARINLTGIERACFSCLLNSPRRELSRESLREVALGANPRSINVAISRLRRKIQETGVRLPLHTVHGTGYVFVGDLSTH
jgi:DNA-binding response OmpR family regulator